MALHDLLWACPECGKPGGIRADGRCDCGVIFRRGRGAWITATHPDGSSVPRPAAEWVDSLPDPASLPLQEGGALRRARAVIREVIRHQPVHTAGRFLNRIEAYGPGREGFLELWPDSLRYGITDDAGAGKHWPLERLTAVQTSSSTLQIKPRHEPLVSFRFHHDSVFLWETLLRVTLRRFYMRTGRGEILEFQPRITAR